MDRSMHPKLRLQDAFPFALVMGWTLLVGFVRFVGILAGLLVLFVALGDVLSWLG